MTKAERMQVYEKYGGHCAYCGKAIQYKDMQVDHIVPRCAHPHYKQGIDIEDIKNKNPACYRCNHYKRSANLETFRQMLQTLHERTQKIYINKVAEDYGIIQIKPWDGKFYFEMEVTNEKPGEGV